MYFRYKLHLHFWWGLSSDEEFLAAALVSALPVTAFWVVFFPEGTTEA